ncbi:DUF2889 domain-containing protein [Aromatoleum petrolei]|uniref:DUF2889 domain-containing protein n=1 Tax=Aromatoleum petrolei TaxID=76116 RepID=A0ABX1MMX5_9RHOO|nr:DUF2889 domain-containing protein [Aromatoleum petrolei]NMF88551.1 DUF2889 domain-containing protein [Aromatoleum petrolei]
MRFDARGRDLLTRADGTTEVFAYDRAEARLLDRTIETISCTPPRATLHRLIGARSGNQLRSALEEALPDERAAGTPLYLLLDDFAGTSLIAPGVWQHWPSAERGEESDPPPLSVIRSRALPQMEGVCIAFQAGATPLRDVDGDLQSFGDVVPLPRPTDPRGWHPLPSSPGKSLRRARRIDVWHEAGLLHIDAMFQDSASTPSGARRAIHEYSIGATVDAASMSVLAIHAIPRILPYPECPSAVANLHRLIGAPLRQLRTVVIERLPKTMGCTHLNDALRSLAEVPLMAETLDRALAARGLKSPPE